MKTNVPDKMIKDTILNVRISKTEKEQYTMEAKKYGMNLSELVLNLLRYKKLNVIERGGEIAKAIYDLNNSLNKYENGFDSMDNIRTAMSNCVARMNDFLNDTSDENVYSKV